MVRGDKVEWGTKLVFEWNNKANVNIPIIPAAPDKIGLINTRNNFPYLFYINN